MELRPRQFILLRINRDSNIDMLKYKKENVMIERIIEKIWGGDSNAEYNNVEVYISFIRKKIENLGVKARIRTARGIGYSLEDDAR